MTNALISGIPRKVFFLRLALSLLLVPLAPPALLLLSNARTGAPLPFHDALGIFLIYGAFGLLAMVVLGMPLLFCLIRMGRTGFLPFIAGGAFCAGVVALAMLRAAKGLSLVPFFIGAGAVSGLVFRVILFGVRADRSVPPRTGRLALIAAAGFVAATAIAGVYCFSEEHRSVTEQMGWQCTGVTDTKYPAYPHIESAKFWYLKNPRYEENATGPNLCADLQAANQPSVSVTFDVWGSKMRGLHGYDGVGVAAGGRQFKIFEFGSGGYHDDTPHYGNYSSAGDLAAGYFPLNVFR